MNMNGIYMKKYAQILTLGCIDIQMGISLLLCSDWSTPP
jgi:hypothetical protein